MTRNGSNDDLKNGSSHDGDVLNEMVQGARPAKPGVLVAVGLFVYLIVSFFVFSNIGEWDPGIEGAKE